MKTFKRLVVSIVSLSLTVSLTGCGIIREMMSILNGSYPEEVSTSEPTSYEKVETMIGKDGGVVKDEEENVTISIPQGALSEDTNISAQYIEEPSYLEANPSMNFLGAVEFGPSGTTFAKPVEVSLQLTDTPKHNKISIFCYSEEYQLWDFVTEANVNYDVATFSISHFSKYKALDMSPNMLMKFHNLVKQAQAEGKTDSWVLENFQNYLINEEHVMDIYSLYDGYWYEPCGLLIGGNYHINGKEGDPNQLTTLIGETNMVGNTYGLCHDAELVIDVQTYKQIEGKPKESQEIISVNVGVYYKMIKPDIDLTASKKNLHKGDSATINIRCHYVNASNYFDEFKDLEMDNYMLTIVKPTHFEVDRTSVVTNDGRANFTVTAKEDNVAETITVNFDVSGSFGVHAEGNITLNSEGHVISGTIEETITISYYPYGIGGYVTANGVVELTIEYDVNGSFTINEGVIDGSVDYSNINASVKSTACHAVDDESSCDYNLFKSITSVIPSNTTLAFTGTASNDVCSINSTSSEKEIVTINGAGNTIVHEGGHSEVMDENNFVFKLSSNKALMDFAIGEAGMSYTYSELKDKLSMANIDWLDIGSFPLDESGLICTYSYSTTQTITVD